MKASMCGTWTEQKLFRAEYKTKKERGLDTGIGKPRCLSCDFAENTDHVPMRLRCNKLETMVMGSAICKEWRAA